MVFLIPLARGQRLTGVLAVIGAEKEGLLPVTFKPNLEPKL